MSFRFNNQILCYSCEQPITSRKEFGMSAVMESRQLEPFHIHCWVKLIEGLDWKERGQFGRMLKLTAEADPFAKQSPALVMLGCVYMALSGVVGVWYFATPPTFLWMPFAWAAITLALTGILAATYSWTKKFLKRSKERWNECIALIPEREGI